MDRQNLRESLADVGDDFEFEWDMQVAAGSRAPVLISASPRCALMLAQAIAGRLSRAERNIRILTCDVADCGDLDAAFAPRGPEPPQEPRASILLLREVHALSTQGQTVLKQVMSRRQLEAPRVFASSSVSLYRRVQEGRFDPGLFYYLNAIHIVASDEAHPL